MAGSGSEGNIPSPNFNQGNSDFLQFSSTPIEGKNFKPKWGKRNRQDNWNRFGQHTSGPGESPVSHGHQRGGWQAGGRGGGWRGGHQFRGGGGRGGFRGRGGNFNNSWHGGSNHNQSQNRSFNHNNSFQQGYQNQDNSEGYFHPGMLEDPWAELEKKYNGAGNIDASYSGNWEDWESNHEQHSSMSESLIAQVGDTLNERNEKLLDDTESKEVDNSETLTTEGGNSEDDPTVSDR